ncbi:MAG: transporter substrate-binding domain-containing protein [Synergistaceae bacterium]|nr:transporter substrate-binding domain-containing protein [Synergistaceae bacterium]MBR0204862.1 transporter substrate-binding domain-containing protein [Synergistaceae bacterium]
MKAKKFVLALAVILVIMSVVTASALERKVGHLAKLNMTPEEFKAFSNNGIANGRIAVFLASEISEQHEIVHLFYDSFLSLQMALNAGEVDEVALPEAVADYVLNMNDGYKVASIVRTYPSTLSFGFRKDDDPAMLNRFNEALLAMKADGTLAILREKYINDAGFSEPEPVEFRDFENIDTKIKVAVTGDLPPIDFVSPEGKPAGFNTAVLAEIAKRLHINIEIVNIDSGARAAALASKRVDAVFWFQFRKNAETQPDIPEGVALSEPYYTWNEILNIAKK